MKPGLRLTLLASLLPLLALPWIGLRFVESFAVLARDAQLENLQAAARGLAASLHERSELFGGVDGDLVLPRGVEAVEVSTLAAAGDARAEVGVAAHPRPLAVRLLGQAPASTLAVRIALARTLGADTVRLSVEADDERFVAPGDLVTDGSAPLVAPGDALTVSVGGAAEWVRALQADRRARASGAAQIALPGWRERIPVALEPTATGWRAALDLPADTRLIRVQVDDVDYIGTRRIEAQADSGLLLLTGLAGDDAIGADASRRDRRWAEVLRALERAGGRVSIHAADGRLLAQRGEVVDEVAPGAGVGSAFARWLLRLAQPDRIAPGTGTPLANALAGVGAASTVRIPIASGMPAWQIVAAQPVWIDGSVAGALVLEESTVDRLALGQATLERVTLLAAGAMLSSVLALAGIGTLLVARIGRLGQAADRAIDARGRVVGGIPRFRLGDEVGALAASYARLLERLREHQHYLARLRSRLVHELRTPIMVVRSSLENLAADPSPQAAARYAARAEEGAARLERLVANMSEAGSLESMLADGELQVVDLRALCDACVDAWRISWPAFDWQLEVRPQRGRDGALLARVVPDAVAQALDKLASNAADFAESGSRVVLDLACDDVPAASKAAGGARHGERRFTLAMRNRGPALPASMASSLFESMVSVRADATATGEARDATHLGLGLYLVRVIAEFHGGEVFAADVAGGVRIGFTLRG
ncbi:MAG: ATP-binding protein [Lautropia sp.]